MAAVGFAARAERIAALGFNYHAQPKTRVERCNLCGDSQFIGLTRRDRYGYPASASGCARCGLVFLDPVMTAAAYGSFYQAIYRPLVSAFHGRVIDARTIQDEQREYAIDRGDLLARYLDGRGYQTLLDVGGSTGVVADALAKRFDLRATVVDPAPLETAQAQALGLETIEGLIEQIDFDARQFDVVILCQTVDHLLDVTGTLHRLRQVIAPGGLFFVDIVDFRAAYLRNASVESAVKIDHPYYLTEPTMMAFLRRAGFDVVRTDYAADHLHVSYVAAPAAPQDGALPPAESVSGLWREIRSVQNAPGRG
jgi:ubiquinone/menaquinone biosynthesis C-methylase UbiE